MNTLFFVDNLIDDSEITILKGTEYIRHPISNIKHIFTTNVCRIKTDIDNKVELLIDLKHFDDVDSFIINGNFKNGLNFNSLSIYGSDNLDFTLSDEIQIDLNYEHFLGYKLFNTVNYRYWKLVFTGNEYIEICNMFIGQKVKFTQNGISTKSFQYSLEDRSQISLNDDNNPFINIRNTVKSISGDLKTLIAVDYDLYKQIWNSKKKHIPFWFILDPESRMPEIDSKWIYSGYVRFNNNFDAKMIVPGIYDCPIDLLEMV